MIWVFGFHLKQKTTGFEYAIYETRSTIRRGHNQRQKGSRECKPCLSGVSVSENQEKPPTTAKFPVGAAVRVKIGTMDPDFSDVPIGGWAGTIQESDPSVDISGP